MAAILVLQKIVEEAAEIFTFFLSFPRLSAYICSNAGNSENTFCFWEALDYDPNGNRVRKELSLIRTFTDASRYYENTERLMTDGDYGYVYDAAGNMTEKGNRYTIEDDTVTFAETSGEGVEYYSYEYDLLNRLVGIEKNGELIREYQYDPDGLRTVTINYTTGETTHYQYEGTEPIFEKNVTAGEIRSYVFVFGKHLARVDSAVDDTEVERYYYTTDQVGSVRVVSDGDGAIVWKGEYSAFGVLLFEEAIDAAFSDSLRFSGKSYDDETGLYYFNARYYDARTGRFVSGDPVRDGLNWYVYGGNNPVRFTDPTGLLTIDQNGNVVAEDGGSNPNLGSITGTREGNNHPSSYPTPTEAPTDEPPLDPTPTAKPKYDYENWEENNQSQANRMSKKEGRELRTKEFYNKLIEAVKKRVEQFGPGETCKITVIAVMEDMDFNDYIKDMVGDKSWGIYANQNNLNNLADKSDSGVTRIDSMEKAQEIANESIGDYIVVGLIARFNNEKSKTGGTHHIAIVFAGKYSKKRGANVAGGGFDQKGIDNQSYISYADWHFSWEKHDDNKDAVQWFKLDN